MDSPLLPDFPTLRTLEVTLEASVKRAAFVYVEMRKHFAPLMPKSDSETKCHQICSMYFRVQAWMSTLRKLDHFADVQAISCGLRSLLELAVDMILLHKDETEGSEQKINAWGESSRLKFAELAIDFAQRAQEPGSERRCPDYTEFIRKNKKRIADNRERFWPRYGKKAIHPERWTGSTSLLSDIRMADKCFSKEIHRHLAQGLEELYESEYRRWNWFVHGSGLTGFSFDHAIFYLISSTGLDMSVRLALLCSEIYLREINSKDPQRVSPALKELESLRASVN